MMPRVFLTAVAPILVVAAVGYLLARLRLIEDPRPLSRIATQSSMPTAIGAALVAVEFNVRPAFVSGAILVTTLGSAVTLTILLLLLGG